MSKATSLLFWVGVLALFSFFLAYAMVSVYQAQNMGLAPWENPYR